jgi:hypothetical protein
MAEPAGESLPVSSELYIRVRRHCDRCGIRLVDFVEQALEEAMVDESVSAALEKEIEWLRRKTVFHDQAFNRGFQRGFWFWFRMINGTGFSEEEWKELDAVNPHPPVVSGEQLKLF